MVEYIEREKLLNELQEEIDFETTIYTKEQNKYFNMGLKCAVRDVKSQPTADVVKVVRCKDCKHCHEYQKWNFDKYLGCNFNGEIYEVEPTHFCRYGEVKESGNNA